MNVLAIYAVNQHLADLHEEARRNRLADMVDEAAVAARAGSSPRSGPPLGAGSADPSPTAASAA